MAWVAESLQTLWSMAVSAQWNRIIISVDCHKIHQYNCGCLDKGEVGAFIVKPEWFKRAGVKPVCVCVCDQNLKQVKTSFI